MLYAGCIRRTILLLYTCVCLQVMPFPKDVVAQLDYNSRLRLTICFFRMKSMLKLEEDDHLPAAGQDDCLLGESCEQGGGGEKMEGTAARNSMQVAKPTFTSLFKPGMLQELMCEVCMCLVDLCSL